ncbi:hypothetical protein JDV02_000764 [Purpureocillium takamizusanense]|uniref:Gfd2/YDR514C-like C-terminal domain-containing protein n=1 Tax=Purpureocillium takamizusanense TaxID=2060973 RepID=A0A9Q8Q807_9HYPO|nr:uncharacterized protein JDV02_000764 [Purpureocillium takamizusanense]UNI14092.1 hypothetical protein JDV02_000764 [Purpureocillium takamizusanense]
MRDEPTSSRSDLASYYLHDPRNPDKKPHLLVPTVQFEAFLCGINRELDTQLTIPPGQNRHKFGFNFEERGRMPRPRYLARSENQDSLQHIDWPKFAEEDAVGFNEASEADQAAFVKEFDRLLVPNPITHSERTLDRARQKAFDRRAMMEQVQKHLGLELTEDTLRLRPVFICVDIEALEDPPHPVSEVGIAILDAEKIRIIGSGTSGSNWWPSVKCIHLRTEEYRDLKNHKYVQGCPRDFNFGASLFPRQEDLALHIRRIVGRISDDGRRDLLFVAHDTKQDLKFLHRIGVDFMALPGVVGEIDTVTLHQEWRNSNDARSLRTMLSDLGIDYSNLHNAGNDAMYTMRAMLGLATEALRKSSAEARGEKYVPHFWLTGSRWEDPKWWT